MEDFNEITFSRKSFEDAFGFECMKMAYKLNLKGRMDYGPETRAIIRLQGDQENKNRFLMWLRSSIGETSETLYFFQSDNIRIFNEFDIYRH